MSDAFICLNCGRETNFPIFHNLNITAEPRFKEEILSHRLFHFGCSCGFETEVVYPMLYHDMERKFMIFMIPDEDERVPEQMRASLMPLAEQGYVFRLVRNVNELCEKILIGDADLDDTAVELLKFVGEVPFKEDHPGYLKWYFMKYKTDMFLSSCKRLCDNGRRNSMDKQGAC